MGPGVDRLVRWGMAIDLDKCTACQACTFACISENNQPFVGPLEAKKGRVYAWHDFIVVDRGERVTSLPRPCMQCDNAPCIRVCPVGARFYFEGKIVLVSYDRCIGCRLCMVACPYDANYFRWYRYDAPEPMDKYLNPDEITLPEVGRVGPSRGLLGVTEKCTFCIHKLVKLREDLARGEALALSNLLGSKVGVEPSWEGVAKVIDALMRSIMNPSDKELGLSGREIWYLPACVSTCTGRARVFGDLDDPRSLVHEWAQNSRAFVLLEEMGTRPKVIYLTQG